MKEIYVIYNAKTGEIYEATKSKQEAIKKTWEIIEKEVSPEALLMCADKSGYDSIREFKNDFIETGCFNGTMNYWFLAVPFSDK